MRAAEVTRLLRAWRADDGGARDRLTPLVYRNLQRLAHQARRGVTTRHGGGARPVSLDEARDLVGTPSAAISDLDDALRWLEAQDLRKAQVLELHDFGGLSYEEMAAVPAVSPSTIDHRPSTIDTELRFAKAWLRQALGGTG